MPLDGILQSKEEELKKEKAKMPLSDLRRAAKKAGDPRSFANALRFNGNVRIIGEVKKASPSKGVIKGNFNPVAIAEEYEDAGVDALSVLTEESKFKGRLQHLEKIREAVNLPILRKDFMLDEYHIWQARAAGADAVLLIVAILEDAKLKELSELAADLGMAAIIEVHNEAELKRALRIEPKILGVNNRNLNTFKTKLETTFTLRPRVPREIIFVSESGIDTHDHIRQLEENGVDAALIGESFMRANSIAKKMAEFREKNDPPPHNESVRPLTHFESPVEMEGRSDERSRQDMRHHAHGGRAGGG